MRFRKGGHLRRLLDTFGSCFAGKKAGREVTRSYAANLREFWFENFWGILILLVLWTPVKRGATRFTGLLLGAPNPVEKADIILGSQT